MCKVRLDIKFKSETYGDNFHLFTVVDRSAIGDV